MNQLLETVLNLLIDLIGAILGGAWALTEGHRITIAIGLIVIAGIAIGIYTGTSKVLAYIEAKQRHTPYRLMDEITDLASNRRILETYAPTASYIRQLNKNDETGETERRPWKTAGSHHTRKQ